MKIILIVMFLIVVVACSSSKKGPTYNGETLGSCPSSPNCVTSGSGYDGQVLESFEYNVAKEEAHKILRDILKNTKNSEIVTSTDRYIHVIFRSGVFKFKDDVEFVFRCDSSKIDFRSAARSGYSDFGVNKKRMLVIKEEFSKKALKK